MKPCILPWINFSTNPYGRPRTCGYSDLDVVKQNKKILRYSTIHDEWISSYFNTIRKEFLEGKWPENCKRCKYVEELGGISKRMDENEAYFDRYEYLINWTKPDGSVKYMPKHIDVRTGTTCNQKCIHCGTSVSSKWREDTALFDKYPNTETVDVNDRWIDKETKFWDYLRKHMSNFTRYNFLGGESFANKLHNQYLKELSESPYAADVELQYVTNGVLLTQERLEQLNKFKYVKLRLSVDAPGAAGEYFRFPMDWSEFLDKTSMINSYIANKSNWDVGFQWTCSNISMYYLPELYPLLTEQFDNIKFIFSNYVEFPQHMSAQTLPQQLKETIAQRISEINYRQDNRGDDTFYVNHMLERDTWSSHGPVFMTYLSDLDRTRGCDWRTAFSEMELEQYV